MEEHPHPSIQEQHDPNDAIDMEQERRDHLRESILHKELEEALKVKVEETLEGEGVIEGSCHGKVISRRNKSQGIISRKQQINFMQPFINWSKQ